MTEVRLRAMKKLPPILSANASPISSIMRTRPSQLNLERSNFLHETISPPTTSRYIKVQHHEAPQFDDKWRRNNFSEV